MHSVNENHNSRPSNTTITNGNKNHLAFYYFHTCTVSRYMYITSTHNDCCMWTHNEIHTLCTACGTYWSTHSVYCTYNTHCVRMRHPLCVLQYVSTCSIHCVYLSMCPHTTPTVCTWHTTHTLSTYNTHGVSTYNTHRVYFTYNTHSAHIQHPWCVHINTHCVYLCMCPHTTPTVCTWHTTHTLSTYNTHGASTYNTHCVYFTYNTHSVHIQHPWCVHINTHCVYLTYNTYSVHTHCVYFSMYPHAAPNVCISV